MEQGYGGPVWHASASALSGWPTDQNFLRRCARAALEGVGNASEGEWEHWGNIAYHIRRRLSADEQAQIGDMVDVRGTAEAITRHNAVRQFLPIHMRDRRE